MKRIEEVHARHLRSFIAANVCEIPDTIETLPQSFNGLKLVNEGACGNGQHIETEIHDSGALIYIFTTERIATEKKFISYAQEIE